MLHAEKIFITGQRISYVIFLIIINKNIWNCSYRQENDTHLFYDYYFLFHYILKYHFTFKTQRFSLKNCIFNSRLFSKIGNVINLSIGMICQYFIALSCLCKSTHKEIFFLSGKQHFWITKLFVSCQLNFVC